MIESFHNNMITSKAGRSTEREKVSLRVFFGIEYPVFERSVNTLCHCKTLQVLPDGRVNLILKGGAT